MDIIVIECPFCGSRQLNTYREQAGNGKLYTTYKCGDCRAEAYVPDPQNKRNTKKGAKA